MTIAIQKPTETKPAQVPIKVMTTKKGPPQKHDMSMREAGIRRKSVRDRRDVKYY